MLLWSATWNVVDLNVLEIPGNPEVLDNHFGNSEISVKLHEIPKSRSIFLGFPKSGKSHTLSWVVKYPLD